MYVIFNYAIEISKLLQYIFIIDISLLDNLNLYFGLTTIPKKNL